MAGDTNRYSTTNPVSVAKDNPLTTLIHRLEAATSRLEDIANSANSLESQANGSAPPTAGLTPNGSMPDVSAPHGGGGAGVGGSREPSTGTVMAVKEDLPPRIEDMDELLERETKNFVEASNGLDPLVEEQVSVQIRRGTWRG